MLLKAFSTSAVVAKNLFGELAIKSSDSRARTLTGGTSVRRRDGRRAEDIMGRSNTTKAIQLEHDRPDLAPGDALSLLALSL